MPPRPGNDPYAVRFGAIIRRLREQRGWTLRDFGRVVKMNPTYLGVPERGENVTTLSTAIHLAKALGAEAWQLMREIEGQG